jgi:hypothetical protein
MTMTNIIEPTGIGAGTSNSGYSGFVRGTAARFPRGGVWSFAAWYALGAAAFIWGSRPTAAFAAVVIVVLAAAAAGLIWAQGRAGYKRFAADAGGLHLGVDSAGDERRIDVPWTDVQELQIVAASYGTRLQVVLSPAAQVRFRSAGRQLADLAFMFFVPVAGARRNFPAVLVPRRDPVRYQIPLVKVTSAELQAALARLAPGIPIVVSG